MKFRNLGFKKKLIRTFGWQRKPSVPFTGESPLLSQPLKSTGTPRQPGCLNAFHEFENHITQEWLAHRLAGGIT